MENGTKIINETSFVMKMELKKQVKTKTKSIPINIIQIVDIGMDKKAGNNGQY